MNDRFRRRVERLARILAPCEACSERARKDEESHQQLCQLADELQKKVLAEGQPKDASALQSEAAGLRAEAARLREQADFRDSTDWRADLDKHFDEETENTRRLFNDDCPRCTAEKDQRANSTIGRLATQLTQHHETRRYDPGWLRYDADDLERRAAELGDEAVVAVTNQHSTGAAREPGE